ncbi:MAG: translation initiation factor [Calditrichaeota bacterium]|nr:translation initiation factor [Calditrichota bacterium]
MKEKPSKLVYSTDRKAQEQIKAEKKQQPPVKDAPAEKQTIHISLQTKGRKGKKVTVASGFVHSAENLKQLARELKQACGAGGTVKDDVIEIQGDKRQQVAQFLLQRGYRIRGV